MLRQAPLILSITSLFLVLVLFYLRNQPSAEDPIRPIEEELSIPAEMMVRSKTVSMEIPDSLTFRWRSNTNEHPGCERKIG